MTDAFFDTVQSWTGNPLVDELMVLIATYLILVIPLSLVVLWLAGYRQPSFTIFVITILSIAIAQLLGLGFYHEPPHLQGYETILENDPENAFPSNHAAAIFGFAAGTVVVRYRRFAAVATIVAIMIGVARVYTGLHFPVDIAGGAAAALIAGVVLLSLQPYVEALAAIAIEIDDRLRETIGLPPAE